jgi:hypothetical protein
MAWGESILVTFEVQSYGSANPQGEETLVFAHVQLDESVELAAPGVDERSIIAAFKSKAAADHFADAMNSALGAVGYRASRV